MNKRTGEHAASLVRGLPDAREGRVFVPHGLRQAPVLDLMCSHFVLTLAARQGRASIANAEQPVVTIEVSDTGKGIPPEVQKRIFDPFFSTKEGGTGLGLAIASRIIEKHGGFIQYFTQPNRGTTFSLVLPRDHESAPSPH